MTDKKISQLTAVTTPLAGTEVLPIVQSGSTKKVTVDEINSGLAKTAASNTFTQPQVFPSGSAAAPAITTTGDTDTGIYFPAANTIGFTVGGVEAGRFDSGRNWLVGATATVGSAKQYIVGTVANFLSRYRNLDAAPSGIDILYLNASPNGTFNNFLYCSDSTALRFSVRSNGGIANYQANDANLSDRREKTNFAPAKNYLETICAIPVQTFNYIDQNMEDDAGLTLGVVAQDVQAVAPELVTESNWGTEDNPKMRLSIYQTDLQYVLMKSIQELKAELDSVKAQLSDLKGE